MLRIMATLVLAACAGSLSAKDAKSEKNVREGINKLVPNAQVDSIRDMGVGQMYEVILQGQVVYVSADGKYLMQGTLMEIDSRKDLTESAKSVIRKSALAAVGNDKRIIFPAKNEKFKVTVFTDIDCGYCRRMHEHMAEYNDSGITVEYLFFPRSGLGTESAEKAISVWCAADRNKAMTMAKSNQAVEKKTCSNPIDESFELARKVGVNGTPAIIAADGSQIGGYVTPVEIVERLTALQSGSN